VHARLQAEPTILAPRRRLHEVAARYAMPVAAAVAGIVVGGWWMTPSQQAREDAILNSPTASFAAAPAPNAAPAPLVAAQANGQVKEYMLAHQEFSPTSAMQGAASYMRTITFKDADNAQ
jgi:sigma-E factor negative regulatory protein RseA